MKKCFYFFIVLGFFSCKSAKNSSSKTDKETQKVCSNLVENAKENLGSPYLFGGTTKKGFDCSGLVFVSYQKEGIKLPRTSFEMAKTGKNISKEKTQKGDLVFFKIGNSTKINHVGMVVENKNKKVLFIHASTKKGVIISSLEEAYYKKAFSHCTRIVE